MNERSNPHQNDVAIPLMPVEVELFIEPDGTVVFADLAEEVIPLAQNLNPDQPLVCDIPEDVNTRDRGIPA